VQLGKLQLQLFAGKLTVNVGRLIAVDVADSTADEASLATTVADSLRID